MQRKTIHYQDKEQNLIGELFLADNAKVTVVLFPAFEGRSEFLLDYAHRLAKKGFNSFAADIYGDVQTADTIDGCYKLIKPFLEDRSLVRRRACLAIDTIKALRLTPDIDAAGFCFGGMCVLEAARAGVDIRRIVSLHGVLAKSSLPTETIKSKVLILQGFQDPQVPASQLFDFSEEMKQANNEDWTFVFFGNGKHSFTDPLTGSFDPEKEKEMGREYNKTIADQSFHYLIDFLQ